VTASVVPRAFDALDWGLVVAIVVLVAASAVMALAETSLTRMSRARAMALAESGRRGAAALRRLVDQPEGFLAPVLLLTLVFQLVAATLVGVLTAHQLGLVGVVIGIVAEIVVIFVIGEAIPKNWAVRNPDRAALLVAPVIAQVVRFPPVRWVARALVGLANLALPTRGGRGPDITESEILAMADVAVQEEVLETEERALIRSILDFGDTVVREVMVPRPDMIAVEGEDDVAHVLEVAMAAGYSRIPVYGQNIDDIVGVVYTKDLMKADLADQGDRTVAELARPAHFVPETKRVSELLREMQDGAFHMAIVVDEYGGTAGLVTLEDLIEELVGEIVDEFDVEEPLAEPLASGGYRVNARMPLDEVNDLLGATLPEGDWDTIGGLVYGLLGHVPQEGETAEIGGVRLVAEKVQGRRIGRVRLEQVAEAEPAEGRSGGQGLRTPGRRGRGGDALGPPPEADRSAGPLEASSTAEAPLVEEPGVPEGRGGGDPADGQAEGGEGVESPPAGVTATSGGSAPEGRGSAASLGPLREGSERSATSGPGALGGRASGAGEPTDDRAQLGEERGGAETGPPARSTQAGGVSTRRPG